MDVRLRRLRAFLDLSRADVSDATGVALRRIAAAENGRIRLTPLEEKLLSSFLFARLRLVAEVEGWASTEALMTVEVEAR